MSWVRCPSAAPIIKNSRQRGALPSKTPAGRSGRLSIDSWTEQHPQILFSRIISANIAERARSRSRSGGVLSTANTASAGIRRHPPARAAHTGHAPNFCRAAWTIRAYYRTATDQSLGDHITKSLPGRRENKDRSTRHVSEGILHKSWQMLCHP